MTSENIVDNLIRVKENKGWTNYRVAIECNLPTATVANIFKKKSIPQLDTLLSLCRGLGISFANLDKSARRGLSESDNELIQMWDNLSDEEKTAFEQIIKLYIKKSNNL